MGTLELVSTMSQHLNNARRVVAQHGYRDPFWVSKDWYISSARFDISLYLSPYVLYIILWLSDTIKMGPWPPNNA